MRLALLLAAYLASLLRDVSLVGARWASWPFRFSARRFDRAARFFERRI